MAHRASPLVGAAVKMGLTTLGGVASFILFLTVAAPRGA
jgi:hypothetical protein